jgi:Lhr-like helicase
MKTAQTLLFTGRSSATLEEAALKRASEIVKGEQTNHPDISIIKPEGKLALHSADKIRDMIDQAYIPPFQSKQRVFILLEADKMWPVSANTLLKTLEEPPSTTVFILTSCHKERILPTLLSRCQTEYFEIEKEELYQNEHLDKILSKHSYSNAMDFFDDVKSLSHYLDQFRKGDPVSSSDLTAVQKEQLEKEAEGMRQLVFQEELSKVFDTIARYHVTQLDKALKLIQEAKLKRERSCSLTSIFESLFIKLGYLND